MHESAYTKFCKSEVSDFFISSFYIIYKYKSSSIWKEALENYKINV